MGTTVKYLTDEQGNRIAVQIPYEDWQYLTQENKKLKQMVRVKYDLQEGFREVAEYRKGNVSLKTLDQWLDEL